MNLFETDESQERLREAFNEMRAVSSLAPDDLRRISFSVPVYDDNRKLVRGLVQYKNGMYISEVSVTFSYDELVEGEVALLSHGYKKALTKLARRIPKIKKAVKCLTRLLPPQPRGDFFWEFQEGVSSQLSSQSCLSAHWVRSG